MRRYILTSILIAALVITFMAGCQTQTGQTVSSPTTTSPAQIKAITVFAGSSAKGAMEPAGKAFEAKTGIKVYFNFGGSGTLLSQIKLSKTGDLFFPASPDYITKAAADSLILPETETRIYYLIPAILVQKNNPKNIQSLTDLAQPGLRVGICDPQSVPAGKIAYEVLDKNNALLTVGKNVITYAESNEKLSSLVILKSIDAALAFDNVGLQQPNTLDVAALKGPQIPRISYMSGVITSFSSEKESAQKFLDFLTNNEGRAFFNQYKYYTSEEEAKKLAPDAVIGGEYILPANYQPLVK